MNVNSSSQLVVHAPKPIRPVFNGVGRLHRRSSSAASGAATTAAAAAQAQSGSSAAGSTLTSPVSPAFNPSSMPSPVPIECVPFIVSMIRIVANSVFYSARDASEELWSIFKRTASASPSSASFPPPASQLQRTPSAFQERASPLHLSEFSFSLNFRSDLVVYRVYLGTQLHLHLGTHFSIRSSSNLLSMFGVSTNSRTTRMLLPCRPRPSRRNIAGASAQLTRKLPSKTSSGPTTSRLPQQSRLMLAMN